MYYQIVSRMLGYSSVGISCCGFQNAPIKTAQTNVERWIYSSKHLWRWFTIQSISHLSQVTCTHQFPTKALCTAIMSSRYVEHVNSHKHKLIATYTADNGRSNCELEIHYCNGRIILQNWIASSMWWSLSPSCVQCGNLTWPLCAGQWTHHLQLLSCKVIEVVE